ncbi:MAG TPA: NAD-dependent epimerase/dehydratase family protein [Gemmatimonadales bacterium]|nr:NAD-dependent epimerase/dehydratase family protein [Gemmatimonadales bacterium]
MTISGKRVLLTGGAGFIGSRLAARLLADNEVVVFDSGHRDSLRDTAASAHRNLTLIRGDVLDAAALTAAARGCQAVVHLAAIAGVDTVIKMPVETMKVNILGTHNALEAARALPGLERFIDFSTSEVFGAFAFKVREGDATSLGAVGEARWTYAVSKLATEHLAFSYHRAYGVPAVAVRPFNIYGPGQVGEGAIHRFIVQALRNEDITIHNDGSQIRAWCYVDDMVDGILAALERPEAVGHTFNIGNPRSVLTIYQLAQDVVRLSGSTSRLTFKPWGSTEVELRIPNIDKARELLGYEPKVDLAEGLMRTIEWYRARTSR